MEKMEVKLYYGHIKRIDKNFEYLGKKNLKLKSPGSDKLRNIFKKLTLPMM